MPLFRTSFFCSVFVLACNSFGATPIKVFLLAGQSNMSGWTSTSCLPANLTQPQPGVLINVNGEVSSQKAKKWLQCGPDFGRTLGYFGPELTFGKTNADSVPGKKIALIKYSVGGTQLATRWRPPSSGKTVGDLYVKFMKEIDTALATLDKQYTPEIAAMLWMQGEYDALNLSYANEYEYNLGNFIKDVRAKVKNPWLPFIIGMIDVQNVWTYNQIVRTAETNVAKIVPNVGIFDTRGYPTDGVHYLRDGMIRLGQSFALTYLARFVQTMGVVRAPGPAQSESFNVVVRNNSIRIYLPQQAYQQSLMISLFDLSGRETMPPVNTVTCGGDVTIGLDRCTMMAKGAYIVVVSLGRESWRVLGVEK